MLETPETLSLLRVPRGRGVPTEEGVVGKVLSSPQALPLPESWLSEGSQGEQ